MSGRTPYARCGLSCFVHRMRRWDYRETCPTKSLHSKIYMYTLIISFTFLVQDFLKRNHYLISTAVLFHFLYSYKYPYQPTHHFFSLLNRPFQLNRTQSIDNHIFIQHAINICTHTFLY